MKFLADMGVSMTTVRSLRELNVDVVHLREQGLHKLPDDQILAKAIGEQRVILTWDTQDADLKLARRYWREYKDAQKSEKL